MKKQKNYVLQVLEENGLKTTSENIATINNYLAQFNYDINTITGADIRKDGQQQEKANGVFYVCRINGEYINECDRVIPTSERERETAEKNSLTLAYDKNGYFILKNKNELKARETYQN